MAPSKYPPPTIVVDTREKQPFEFKWAVSHKQIEPLVFQKVDAGDYTIKETPNVVTIERKKTLGELYNNLIGKDKYERFIRELERMQEYKHKFVVIEQLWADLWDERNFKFARRNKHWAGAMVLGHIINLQADYGVHFIFAGEYAEQLSLKLLVKHYERSMKYAGRV